MDGGLAWVSAEGGAVRPLTPPAPPFPEDAAWVNAAPMPMELLRGRALSAMHLVARGCGDITIAFRALTEISAASISVSEECGPVTLFN